LFGQIPSFLSDNLFDDDPLNPENSLSDISVDTSQDYENEIKDTVKRGVQENISIQNIKTEI